MYVQSDAAVVFSALVYSNIYHLSLQEAHVNACYKHFYYFVREFGLVDSKEFEPLVSTIPTTQ